MTMRAVFGIATLAVFASSPRTVAAEDRWTTPHPGVQYLDRSTDTPWEIRAVVVDLCAPGVRLRATRSDERRRTPSTFGQEVDAEVVVNADFFSFETYGTSGLAVGAGEVWPGSRDTGGSGYLAFGNDRAEFSAPAEVRGPESWMNEVVSGNRHIVNDGVALASDDGSFCTTRHPRTAAGFSRDGRQLILAVVDGRQNASVGMRCSELGALMRGLGAWDAVNLDGGGSSAMWISGVGTVNRPSDGRERVVANHLGVHADGGGEPGSCNRILESAALLDISGSTSTDIDGDGRADACIRGPNGVECTLGGDTFSPPLPGPGLSDDSGWDDPSNYSTLRMGDIDGDLRADICARANAGVQCWPSDGEGFGAAMDGPALADEVGWRGPQYFGTLRLADYDGDGMDDVCVRAAAGFRCYPSTGVDFGAAVVLDGLSDDGGWDAPSRYGTLRMGDINGDLRADVCARSSQGMRCWPSVPGGFGEPIEGPAWSDAEGFGQPWHWGTIRLADIDGDGLSDLCARTRDGVQCHLSVGDGFGAALAGPNWSNDSGWADYDNYSTLMFADVDGDGDRDVCARANAGLRCALFTGSGFEPGGFAQDEVSDEGSWDEFGYFSTLRLADVDGDGRDDLCGRGWGGLRCWISVGNTFGEPIRGPAWSQTDGYAADPYASTLRIVTAKPAPEEPDAGGDIGGDTGPEPDTGHDVRPDPSDDLEVEPDTPDSPRGDFSGADAPGEERPQPTGRVSTSEECACDVPSPTRAPAGWWRRR
jgi:hypothetical protein